MDDGASTRTRRSLHAVAELVMAGPQYRAAGTIRLRVSPGGFRTVAPPDLAVEGGSLTWPGGRVEISGHSCAELATAAGVTPSSLRDVYRDVTPVAPEETLTLDAAAAGWMAECWAVGDAALRRLAPQHEPVLWPEHFDVAVRVDDTNFGVSPGDELIPEPYAYVGPPSPRAGAFWNQPFGAARPLSGFAAPRVEMVLAFFREGRERIAADPPA